MSHFSKMKKPCLKCEKPSLTEICGSCMMNELKLKEKKNDILYNQPMDFKNILKIKLKNNDKIPMNTWTSKNNQSTNYKPSTENNIGLVCNKESGIIGVDLDFYTKTMKDGTIKKYDPINIKEHKEFIDLFGTDYIKKFDTLTQQTTNGGIHLIFKHTEDLKQTQNDIYNIDIRGGNTNGYLVGSGSVVNGKEYKIIHNTTIKPFPQNLKDFLLNNLYDDVSNIINKKSIRKLKKVKKDKQNKKLDTEYKYIISDKKEKEIFTDDLIKWIQTSYNNWIIFGSAMKQIERYDLFDKYSKLDKAKYDKEKNDKYYSKFENKEEDSTYFEYLIFQNFEKIFAKNLLSDIKYKPIEKDIIKPNKIINIDKLGKGLEIKKHVNYIIKSDTGTGKTTLFKNYIQKTQQKFISVVSRRTLAKEQYDDFKDITNKNCLYYEHYGKGKAEMPKDEQGLVICFDSLMKIQNFDLSDRVIFLDEFNSIIEYFISTPTMKDKRIDCLEIFLKIFQEAKQIICVDADISDLSINFIKDILGEHYNFKYIQNKYNHNQNRKCQQYITYKPFLNKILDTEKFIVCCDSKARAIEVHQEYKKKTEKECLLIVADNIKEVEFEKLDKYERVIFSPKVIYGLDSNFIGGRDVFCYYEGQTISPSNMVQQINRERNINNLYYYFSSNLSDEQKYKTEKDLEIAIYQENKEALSIIKCDYEEWVEKLYMKLLKSYYYKKDCFETNKKVHFQQILYSRGFTEIRECESSKGELLLDMKLKAEKWKVLEEYGEEHFDLHSVINNRLNSDVLKIFNTESLRNNPTIFTNDYQFKFHINYCNYIYKDTIQLKDKIEGMNDFVINKIKLDEFKLYKLSELNERLGLDKLCNITEIKEPPKQEEIRPILKSLNYTVEENILKFVSTLKTINDWRLFIINELKDIFGHHNKFNRVFNEKQVRTIKPKKKDFKSKSRMTKEEELEYKKAMETYEKSDKRYTQYSINEKYEEKQKEIYDYRKSKPSMKYSDEEGFFEWKTKIQIINKSI